MPALEIANPNQPDETVQPTAQSIVGIIYPPPEVRSILCMNKVRFKIVYIYLLKYIHGTKP